MAKPILIDVNKASRKRSLSLFEQHDTNGVIQKIRSECCHQMPRNYISWNTLSAIAGFSLLTNDPEYADVDLAGFVHSYQVAKWYESDAPIYCLSQGLLEAFNKTDALHKPEVMQNWKPSLPSFIIALPEGGLISPVRDAEVDYLVVSCSKFNLDVWRQQTQHDAQEAFQWATVDQRETVWFSSTAIAPNGDLLYLDNSDLGRDRISQEDKVFISQVRNLVVNILFSIEYAPNLINSVNNADLPPGTAQVKGFGKPQSQNNTRLPRWLGKNYKQQRKPHQGGSHSSPNPHLRRGHWRRLEPGENKPWKQQKAIWIEPTRVN